MYWSPCLVSISYRCCYAFLSLPIFAILSFSLTAQPLRKIILFFLSLWPRNIMSVDYYISFHFLCTASFFLSFRSSIQAVAPWFTYVENREAKDPFYTRIPIYITPIQLQRPTDGFRSAFPPKLQLQGSPFQLIYESIYIQGTRMN